MAKKTYKDDKFRKREKVRFVTVRKKYDHIMCIALLYQPYDLNKSHIIDICLMKGKGERTREKNRRVTWTSRNREKFLEKQKGKRNLLQISSLARISGRTRA